MSGLTLSTVFSSKTLVLNKTVLFSFLNLSKIFNQREHGFIQKPGFFMKTPVFRNIPSV